MGEREEEMFEVEELEILGCQHQEWRQAGKKKKPAVLLSIWEEIQQLDRKKELRGSKVQTKCKLIQDWLKKPLHSKKPKQSEMRDLFEEICNGELPSAQQSLQMEQWGLAPVLQCDQVLCALHAVVSHYHGNTTPSDTLFNPTLDRYLVQAVNAIVRELGTAARDQYGAASQGL
ncbi:hypothetical protein F5J12DRAFT_898532 [Pisolithus orientalis]|uniref:uncharacterized protein n=1 Tax=Pisolithus orientalis TaxID=936130 RepID=UPI00222508C2|nr:uncharacterized protein F5J12DRAFT_898532 [Pisolithus orientalis]KAI5987332.1 hypothetical protein F5J12DRAFT_898532 [Pisolithus orientalis]